MLCISDLKSTCYGESNFERSGNLTVAIDGLRHDQKDSSQERFLTEESSCTVLLKRRMYI